jgi:hypothetical protein
MNCEKGDLAKVRILHPSSEDERCLNGHIVVCEELVYHPIMLTPCWRISPKIKTPRGHCIAVADSCLIPYRPGNEPDETLQWAPVPGKTKETV